MNDLNAQAKPGGSSGGRKHEKIEELTPEQQVHENMKKAAIENHQDQVKIKGEFDDYIQETD